MCGILALIGTPWQASARAALATLRSRGPDAQALWEQDGAVLGHARLSIIDVAGGAQPMTSADGRFVLVHNGEIYNFLDLRRELEERGHAFRTRSDTEVVLAGFAEWDRGLLDRLDGMFAFAIWDQRERRLFAARDRLGIKPLFWSSHKGVALASTLAPFFALDGFPRDADAEAIRDYLAFQASLAPRSFLRAVRQLPPAHMLDWRPGTLAHVERWWDIPEPPRTEASARPGGIAELDSILRKAVSDQLVADVPLGAFLSGGVDSSLVVHYMAEAGARPIKTFSVRFAEAKYDESEAAAAVAERYGTDHQVIDAPRMGAAEIAAAIEAMDQPMADPALVPTVELARQTRRHVTVALSGDGGDELFGGYERFLDTEDLHPPTAARRVLRAGIDVGLLPGALLRRSLSGQELLLYRRVELGPWRRSRKSLASYLVPEAVAAFRPEATLSRWIDLARSFGGRMDTAALMRADLWTYLSEDGLVKSDRAGMAHGLEIRVPLLGNRVADFALAQPATSHVRPEPKALLRALAREKLPNAVWMRKKHGFSVPLQASFNGPWRDFCEHAIGRIRDVAPFLRHEAVSKLWHGALSGRASRRLAYTFVVLSAWLERHPLSYDGVMGEGAR